MSLAAIVILALLFFILTARVRALFSTEVEIRNNIIKTGSVAITVTPNEQLFTADALLPGQSVQNILEIKNSGLSPLHLTLAAKKSSGYTSLYDQLRFIIKRQDGHIIYEGLLKELAVLPITETAIIPQQVETLSVSLELPITAENALDDISTNITFVVGATQAS